MRETFGVKVSRDKGGDNKDILSQCRPQPVKTPKRIPFYSAFAFSRAYDVLAPPHAFPVHRTALGGWYAPYAVHSWPLYAWRACIHTIRLDCSHLSEGHKRALLHALRYPAVLTHPALIRHLPHVGHHPTDAWDRPGANGRMGSTRHARAGARTCQTCCSAMTRRAQWPHMATDGASRRRRAASLAIPGRSA